MVYLFLLFVCFLFSVSAQAKVQSTFRKYDQIRARSGLTGEQAARRILQMYGLNVQIEGVGGKLTDHYDPRNNILRLSEATRYRDSLAAIGVAAHEAGHAVQDETNYFPNKIRAALVPVARIGSVAGPYLAIIGVILNGYNEFGMTLAYIGLILYFFAFLFFLITLPVEFNASKRAVNILENSGILSVDEVKGARKVLNAAAMTYVASATTALVSFLRIFSIVNSGRER